MTKNPALAALFAATFSLAWPMLEQAPAQTPSDSERPAATLPQVGELSFRRFAREVLFGYATYHTPRFDAYTEGSYHVDPPQLVADIPAEAARHGLDLQAVVVVGPYGPVWAYDVVALIRTPECVRVNSLVMPHARITAKYSGCLSAQSATEWLRRLEALAPVVEPCPPGREGDPACCSCLHVMQLADGTTSRRRSDFGCSAEERSTAIEAINSALESLGAQLTPTYLHHPPEAEDAQ